MNKSSIISAAAITIILGAASAATAQGPVQGDRLNHHVERTLMIYDTNGDGTIG